MMATFVTPERSFVAIADDAGQDFKRVRAFAGDGMSLAGARDDGVARRGDDLRAVVVDPGLSGEDVEDLLLVFMNMPADGASGLEDQAGLHAGGGAHFDAGLPDVFDGDGSVAAAHGGSDFGCESGMLFEHGGNPWVVMRVFRENRM